MINSMNVHIGEVKIGRENSELHTILGSCVGIGIFWPKRGVYGLAHCLLPQSPEGTKGPGGRYVDQAIDSLFELMDITNPKDLRAVIAGGANMTVPDCANHKRLIGYQNAQAAIAKLDQMKVRIMQEETGGEGGRKMSICCTTGTFYVREIARSAH